MRLFSHLWQRVFAYSILLILVSHIVSFTIFRSHFVKEMDLRLITEIASNAALALEGKDEKSIQTLMEFFNSSLQKLWIELPDGTIVSGEAPPEFAFQNRISMKPISAYGKPVTVYRSDAPGNPYFAQKAVRLQSGLAVVCIRLKGMPPPPMSAIFLQGLTAVCIIGGALSVWISWRIARPLRRLCSEVLHIADGALDTRVNEKAPAEIAQVARAVNRMAHSLAQNIKRMRELVANLSHEMRSPLARMSISATIIEEGLDALVHRQRQYPAKSNNDAPRLILNADGIPLASVHIGYVQQEIKHMEKLVSSSLLNSRLDSQKDTLTCNPVDLSALCMDIALRHEAMFAEKGLLLTLDIQPNLWVNGDETLLSMVFSNLLDNAFKYTDSSGLVHIALNKQNDSIHLCMENSHPGLEETVLSQLFEPFFRGIATGDSEGAGLGLTLVKKIALCHKGRATVENSDIGLRFSVFLPYWNAQTAAR